MSVLSSWTLHLQGWVFYTFRHAYAQRLCNFQSIHNVTKDIVELTDGRIDLLINAAGTRGDPALKVWDLKGNELEEEVHLIFVVFSMRLIRVNWISFVTIL